MTTNGMIDLVMNNNDLFCASDWVKDFSFDLFTIPEMFGNSQRFNRCINL